MKRTKLWYLGYAACAALLLLIAFADFPKGVDAGLACAFGSSASATRSSGTPGRSKRTRALRLRSRTSGTCRLNTAPAISPAA